jgi:glycosyltransferase involved in cell wall biosynthesis
MNIWLIMSGEPLEMFGERPHRVGILSKMLVKGGHNVTWWTTDYDHQHKKYFFNNDTELKNNFGVEMIFLYPKTKYYRNISYQRIKNHREVGNSFLKLATNKKKPDIIFCAFPTIDLSCEAVKYGKEYNIPIVIDVRDLWPYIFFSTFYKILHPIIKIFLKNYIQKTKYIFQNATAITGVSQKYLDYGLNYGARKQNSIDGVYPLAYQLRKLDNNTYENCDSKFKTLGINKDKILVWFVGTFGKTYDLSTIIHASKEINNDNIQFVFTGDGENASIWKELAKNSKNIFFTGWVNSDDLAYLADICDIGLMAYKKGAPQGLPNKVFEYLASGLPIFSSLQGETKELLEKEKVGFTYNADSVEDFKMSLNKILENDSLRIAMSNRCKKLFDMNFSAEKVYSDLITHLEKIVKIYKENGND